jgi:hypothetical protein
MERFGARYNMIVNEYAMKYCLQHTDLNCKLLPYIRTVLPNPHFVKSLPWISTV